MLAPARPDGTLTNLTRAFPTADFNGADVSFDATQAVFSMKTRRQRPLPHLHRAADARRDGTFEIHQKTDGRLRTTSTRSTSPGGHIVFVTNEMYTAMGTRADEYEHARAASRSSRRSPSTAATPIGTSSRRTFRTPSRRSSVTTGESGTRSWEHFGDVNDVKIMRREPRRNEHARRRRPARASRSNSLFTVKEISPNVMVGIGTARDRTIHAGALVQIDSRNHDRSRLHRRELATATTVGHALPRRRERAVHRCSRPTFRRAATLRRSVVTASRASCRTGGSSSRGRTAPSTT